MVVWTQYLQNIADFMNTTPTQAGIIMSLMITIVLTLVVLIASRGKLGSFVIIPIFDFFCVLFFTFIGWFPTWTGSVIALVLAVFIGYLFSRITAGD